MNTESVEPARLATIREAALHFGKSDQTLRNWVAAGHIVGYVPPKGYGLQVDLNEVRAYLAAKREKTRQTTLRGKPSKAWSRRYGDKARVVNLRSGSVPSVHDGEPR